MSKEITQARRALTRGRADEALVSLWNAIEPARLAGERGALADIARLAEQIRQAGDPTQQQEAERLLRELGDASGLPDENEAAAWAPTSWTPTAPEEPTAPQRPAPTPEPYEAEPGLEVEEATAGETAERPARPGLVRFLVPAIVLLVIILQIVVRALRDN